LAANNIANVNTTGCRGQTPSFRSMLVASSPSRQSGWNRLVNEFAVLDGARLDMAQGNLEHTGNHLDLALEGPGFFAVQTKAGTLYTRNGNFRMSVSGQLVTSAGDSLLGASGPINLPSGDVSISPDGTVSVAGAVAGKLRVVSFEAKTQLTAAGGSYYSEPAVGVSSTAATGMSAQEMNLDNVANNLANSSTAGFRKRRLQFEDLLYQNIVMPGAASTQQTTVAARPSNRARFALGGFLMGTF